MYIFFKHTLAMLKEYRSYQVGKKQEALVEKLDEAINVFEQLKNMH
jgi:hypothetical protein